MPLQFYKANKSVKGAAASLSFNSKDAGIYIELIRQVSWDDSKRTGTFKGGDKCNLKLSMSEAGGILRAIEQKEEFPSAYHSFPGGSTQISFKPYEKDGSFSGFGLSVLRKKDGSESRFLLGFSPSESIVIREFLKFALEHCFSAIYSADKKRFLEKESKMEPKNANTDKEADEAENKKEEPVIDDPFSF